MSEAGKARRKPTKAAKDTGRNDALAVTKTDNESASLATAKALAAPDFRHGQALYQLLHPQLKGSDLEPGQGDYSEAVSSIANRAKDGDLHFASRMLAAQARTLDAIFTEMARRMALNMGEYLGATETYGRIAMKAQAQSRATLEALAKMHQPREQTVRHVHVNEGGQAVIADQVNNYPGGQKNGKADEQCHAPATGNSSSGTAMLGADPQGNGMPITSRQGQAALPYARRDEPRRA